MILQLQEGVAYEVCILCEGEGDIAINFGIASTGRPAIGGCPLCDGLGAVEHTCAAEQLREETQRYGDDLRELADEETDG